MAVSCLGSGGGGAPPRGALPVPCHSQLPGAPVEGEFVCAELQLDVIGGSRGGLSLSHIAAEQ